MCPAIKSFESIFFVCVCFTTFLFFQIMCTNDGRILTWSSAGAITYWPFISCIHLSPFPQRAQDGMQAYPKDRIFLYVPQRALCSMDHHLLDIPGPKDACLASTRARAFPPLALAWCNQLPLEFQSLWDFSLFCRDCKMELFHKAFW